MSEILGTIFKTILALLGVAAAVVMSYSAFNNSKNSNAVSQLSQLVFNAQAFYTGSPFTTLTNSVAIVGDNGAKLAPEDMVSGGNLVNPWNGAVTIAVNASNSANFDVTSAGVSSSGCQKLATSMDTALKISINAKNQTLPLDPGAAATACNSKTSNTLIFTFGH